MSKIIFSESSHANDSRIGKLETPLKMFIQAESDDLTKNKDYSNTLFTTDESGNFAETYIVNDGFGQWEAATEGGTAANDSYGETRQKTIYHNEYRKGFTVTKKMMDDMKDRALMLKSAELAKQFVGSYYETMNAAMVESLKAGDRPASDLIDGKSIYFNGGKIDVTTADGKPLFAKNHDFGGARHGSGTQSNYFYLGKTASDAILGSNTGADKVNEIVAHLSVLMRNFKDENGRPMGYTADTIIIPGDNYVLETLMRRALGSQFQPGTALNDISTQYGTKTLMVLPEWSVAGESNKAQFMIMSSKAKDYLHGNQFLDRVGMDIKNYEDNATRNWVWNGYSRWGVGFATYKHIAKFVFDQAEALTSLATDIETA